MKIWKLSTDANNYDNFTIPDELESKRVLFDYKFDGSSIADRWQPVNVEVLEEKKRSDTPTFVSGCPVLSERAVLILGDMLKGVCEVLPLKYCKEQFYVLNVLCIIDCIDYKNAICKMFPNSDRVMRFMKYAFKPDKLVNKHIFKIPEHPQSYVLVSDEFKNRVLDNALEGFEFIELWDSEK